MLYLILTLFGWSWFWFVGWGIVNAKPMYLTFFANWYMGYSQCRHIDQVDEHFYQGSCNLDEHSTTVTTTKCSK